jgi:glycine/D-amino acid oxidase-like deaminating enzyme
MARILIVGAGADGLSVARAALRRGHAMTLIEQGRRICLNLRPYQRTGDCQ